MGIGSFILGMILLSPSTISADLFWGAGLFFFFILILLIAFFAVSDTSGVEGGKLSTLRSCLKTLVVVPCV